MKKVSFLILFFLDQDPSIHDFTARITKKGSNKGLFVEAAIVNGSVEINSIQYSDNVNDLYEGYLNGKPSDEYVGPDFETLDERLQTELRTYLENLGINDELASFIDVISVDKDQRLYSKWLNDVKNFLH
jgi:complement component 1 Q subcomponent-binding protein